MNRVNVKIFGSFVDIRLNYCVSFFLFHNIFVYMEALNSIFLLFILSGRTRIIIEFHNILTIIVH